MHIYTKYFFIYLIYYIYLLHIFEKYLLSGRTPARGRGRARARGASGALAAAAAAMAGAAAGSAAAYAAYGFSYQANTSAQVTQPANRVSPVAFGSAPSTSSALKQATAGTVHSQQIALHDGKTDTLNEGDEINVTQVDADVFNNESTKGAK